MSQRSVISDPFKFAAETRSLAGDTPVAEFGRLADLLADRQGTIAWRVTGGLMPDGAPKLEVVAEGELQLCCQRCLTAMAWPLALASTLRLVRPGTAIPDDELEIDDYDTIEGEADMDVKALIEDELLLALPVVPRHEGCDAPHPSDEGERKSSFAALSKLQKRGGTE